MKLVAINGSPRKTWNTADLLGACCDMAVAEGVDTALIHLCDLKYSGCRSCFACKRIGSPSFGRCALRDDLTPVLAQILEADVVLFGTPIYFGHVSADMWALLERLWFPSLNYDKEHTVNYPRTVQCGFVFTMNVADASFYQNLIDQLRGNMDRMVGPTEAFTVPNTLQFNDYSQYVSSMFDADEKQRWHDTEYPKQKAQMLDWVKGLMAKA